MSNETVIADAFATLQARLADLKNQAEQDLADLEAAGLLTHTLNAPEETFTSMQLNINTDNMDVSATFDQGLQYPDASNILSIATAGNYDSEFLEYLEGKTKNTPLATWGAALNSLLEVYRDEVTAKATSFATGHVPYPAAYLSSMADILADTLARHESDFANRWAVVLNDVLVEIHQSQLQTGVKIEDVRERSMLDLVNYQSDYNRAVLDMAQADFAAIVDRVDQIRSNVDLYRKTWIAQQGHESRAYDARLRATLLDLDKQLAEESDALNRSVVDYQLKLKRAEAISKFSSAALSQANVAPATLAIRQGTSEG